MSTASARSSGNSFLRAISGVTSAATRQPDYWLLTIVLLMVMFGTVMVFSTTFAMGVQQDGGDGYFYLSRHLMYLIVGLVAMLAAMSIDYHYLQRIAFPALILVMIVLAVMALVPGVASEIYGASRWIDIGPISVQPSEVGKLALILYLASWLASKGNRVREFNYGLIPFAVLMGALIALVMVQPDLGTSLLLTGIGLSMFLVAGANLLHLGLVTTVGGAVFLILALTASYRRDRILAFLNPDSDLQNLGWQLTQAKLAIGSGGLFGVGLGASYQKFAWLPAAHNDAIFAIIAEELGLMGAGFVLMLFIMLAWRGYRVAMRAPDAFGSLIAVGIVTWMIFQAAINIGGITTTIPFTGIPIPFISYGGSSLVVSLAAMGILLNISRQIVDPVDVKVTSKMRSRSAPAHKRKAQSRPAPERTRSPRSAETPMRRPAPATATSRSTGRSSGSGNPGARNQARDGRKTSSTGQFGRSRITTNRRR